MKQLGLLVTSLSVLFNSAMSYATDDKYFPAPIQTEQGHRGVFMDFKSAVYSLNYSEASSQSVAKIEFEMSESGYPVFDIVADPTQVKLDGDMVSVKKTEISLSKGSAETTVVTVVEKSVSAGRHTLEVVSPIPYVQARQGKIWSGFFLNDLNDRGFLERYLPASFEWDTFKMTFHVKMPGTKQPHTLFVNTLNIIESGPNSWTVEYPEHFSTSSLYFHLAPESQFLTDSYDYTSIDGRKIPVTLYTDGSFPGGKEFVNRTLGEIEKHLGPWPHTMVLIYFGDPGSGLAGMEYCGATVSDQSSLRHELIHSYFARGVMPRDGDSGWLDEAVTTYLDENSFDQARPKKSVPSGDYFSGPYNRVTSTDSYFAGAGFISYLNTFFADNSRSFLEFLRQFHTQNMFERVSTLDFKSAAEAMVGKDLSGAFDTAGVGVNSAEAPRNRPGIQYGGRRASLIHRELTDRDILQLSRGK